METLKNFFVGIAFIFLALIVLLIAALAWPLIIGLGSMIFSLLAGIVFIVLLFYFVVLIGYLVRMFFKKHP